MTTTLRGRNALGEGGLAVSFDGDTITEIAAIDDPGEAAPWIGPGLIDLQVNGHGAGDANAAQPSAQHLERMAASLAARGVTRFLPTIITAPPATILARIRAVVDATRDDAATLAPAMIAGIHIEGPSLSDQDGPRGVHDLASIRPPDIGELGDWCDAAAGMLAVVTLSPHFPEAVAATEFLTERGVRVAIGHTHADEAQIRAVVEAGATLSTHLGNGAHATLPRHPNYLWTQLAERRLTAGLIADGHHLPDSALAAMIAAKRGHGEVGAFLVSDAVATPAELLERGESSIGGAVRIVDGALRHVESGFLAGSIDTLDTGVANAARVLGSLSAAVDLASRAPGVLLDGENPWRAGARADILAFAWKPGDRALTPLHVYVAGRPVALSPAHPVTDPHTVVQTNPMEPA